LPPPIQLLIYQIAREATTNALKHAEAENIWISLADTEDGVALTIKDDGKGFDVSQPQPEGHFGSVMMKERALVTGGTYERTSQIGQGTTIRATFPRVWVEEGAAHEARTGAEKPAQKRRQPPVGSKTGSQAPAALPEAEPRPPAFSTKAASTG
jgi:signal transduction histidine kinase